jgi:hypothetical protein
VLDGVSSSVGSTCYDIDAPDRVAASAEEAANDGRGIVGELDSTRPRLAIHRVNSGLDNLPGDARIDSASPVEIPIDIVWQYRRSTNAVSHAIKN